MALKATTQKLDTYKQRLKQKKAKPIDPKQVEKVAAKLKSKHDALKSELKSATKPAKQERLRAKLKVVDELRTRTKWLLTQIDKAK